MAGEFASLLSSEIYVYKQDDIGVVSFPMFEDLRQQGRLCDVTLTIDDQHLRAHRVVSKHVFAQD